MPSELMKRLVQIEEEKQIKDGVTRKLALALIHDLEAAVGEDAADPSEIVQLHRLASPPDLRRAAQSL